MRKTGRSGTMAYLRGLCAGIVTDLGRSGLAALCGSEGLTPERAIAWMDADGYEAASLRSQQPWTLQYGAGEVATVQWADGVRQTLEVSTDEEGRHARAMRTARYDGDY